MLRGTCKRCRYWSEMIAEAGGGRPGVRAMCLAPRGEYHGRMTQETLSCAAFAVNTMGAVDSPGFRGNEYDGVP